MLDLEDPDASLVIVSDPSRSLKPFTGKEKHANNVL